MILNFINYFLFKKNLKSLNNYIIIKRSKLFLYKYIKKLEYKNKIVKKQSKVNIFFFIYYSNYRFFR